MSTITHPVGGVWQRVSLEVPTGQTTDVASFVWWLQTACSSARGVQGGLFADLRIPPRQCGRPVTLAEVLRQRASAGVLECERLPDQVPSSKHTSSRDEVPAPVPVLRCTWHCPVSCANGTPLPRDGVF